MLEIPISLQGPVTPHTIVTLPNTNGMQLLLCYDNEGVYVNTYGKVTKSEKLKLPQIWLILQVSKNIVLQWGELPTSVAYIGTGQIMGWGNKAIEIRFGFFSESWDCDYGFFSQECWDWSPRRGVHAQKGAKVEVPLWEKWQGGIWTWNWIQIVKAFLSGVLLQRQRRFFVPNLLHDAQQTRDGQLVVSLSRPRLKSAISAQVA